MCLSFWVLFAFFCINICITSNAIEYSFVVQFDLDVEIHVVPRDSYQPSLADSNDVDRTDPDVDNFMSSDIDESDKETNDSFSSYSTNLDRDPLKPFTSQGNKEEFELNPFSFGRVSS